MTARTTTCVATALMLWAAAVHAEPSEEPSARPRFNEVYLSSGFSYFGSDRRVLAGAGGGPGYRRHLSSHFAVYAEAQYLVYVGNVYRAVLGASYAIPIGPLWPFVGLQASIYGGDRVDVITNEHPVPPPPIAWAGQARIAPLRFVHEPFTVSALSGDIGFGVDAGTRALAVSISILDIGVRF